MGGTVRRSEEMDKGWKSEDKVKTDQDTRGKGLGRHRRS